MLRAGIAGAGVAGRGLKCLPVGRHDGESLGLPAGHTVLLTLSLAEPHTDGFCYKLAAAVIVLPRGWDKYLR